MLGPLAALALAATILQVVDFGSKVLITGYGFATSTAATTEENVNLEAINDDLQNICDKLADPSQALSGIPDPDHDALIALAEKCHQFSTMLQRLLQGLKLQTSSRALTWEKIQKSIRTVWKRSSIQYLVQLMNDIKASLTLRVLLLLRDGQSSIYSKLRALEVSMLSMRTLQHDSIQTLQSTRRDVLRSVHQLLESTKPVVLQHGTSASADGKQPPVEMKHEDHSAPNNRQELASQQQLVLNELHKLIRISSEASTQHRILSSLLFPELRSRYDSIVPSHHLTCDWMFDGAEIPFEDWLTSERKLFWICGKAGSGKSTLMKHIVNHDRTREALQQWSRGRKLVIAGFYFWSSGHLMERSQVGLLQSLVFQLLRQCPELIPTACPSRWKEEEPLCGESEPWSKTELSATIHRIISSKQQETYFAFFIDGLDEYQGEADHDQYDFIKDIRSLTQSDTTKLCVSSRPWNVFKNAFGSLPDKVVLEHFTQQDMERYVSDVLVADERFESLASRHHEEVQSFIREIGKCADGVFLWVFLAVRSLLRGLTEMDTVSTLRNRLLEIPPKLTEFFRRILDSVDSFYRIYTAQVLQIVLHAGQPLPALAVWFLEQIIDDPSIIYNKDLRLPQLTTAIEQAKWKVNSWCRDLLEVTVSQEDKKRGLYDVFHGSRVKFLHRTVYDYLKTQNIQAELKERAGSSFDPDETLCRLYFASLQWSQRSTSNVPFYLETTGHIMHHARAIELRTGATPFRLLQELDFLGNSHCGHARAPLAGNISPVNGRVTFAALAVMYDLRIYLTRCLEDANSKTIQESAALLHFALAPKWSHDLLDAWSFPNIEMVQLLLSKGVDPNQVIPGSEPQRTAKDNFARQISDMEPAEFTAKQERIDLVRNLLRQYQSNGKLRATGEVSGSEDFPNVSDSHAQPAEPPSSPRRKVKQDNLTRQRAANPSNKAVRCPPSSEDTWIDQAEKTSTSDGGSFGRQASLNRLRDEDTAYRRKTAAKMLVDLPRHRDANNLHKGGSRHKRSASLSTPAADKQEQQRSGDNEPARPIEQAQEGITKHDSLQQSIVESPRVSLLARLRSAPATVPTMSTEDSEKDPPKRRDSKFQARESKEELLRSASAQQRSHGPRDFQSSIPSPEVRLPPTVPFISGVAKQTYTAPSNPLFLGFPKGARITHIEIKNKHWYKGTYESKTGVFPVEYLQEAEKFYSYFNFSQ